MNDQQIILFDGVCNLCNSSVQYVIRHDPMGIFKFATLQGDMGKRLLREYGILNIDTSTFILIQNGVHIRSTAALKVARQLKGPISLLYGFIIVPVFIRNAVYDLIARNRYKWFGKKEHCMVPTPELQERFLN